MYEPQLPDAPPGWSLRDAFHSTQYSNGTVRVGHLQFQNSDRYDDYVKQQSEIGGTRDQLAVLHHLITVPLAESPLMNPQEVQAPPIRVQQLLNKKGRPPNADGFYELGNLRVHESEYTQFATLQKTLCAQNPEARALLYHMVQSQDAPVTFRIVDDDHRMSVYNHNQQTIVWNPNTASRDLNGVTLSPAATALHESFHWVGRKYGRTLHAIPDGVSDLEERRVLTGGERRHQASLGRPQRSTHVGHLVPVNGIDSTQTSLTVADHMGNTIDKTGPWHQRGKVIYVQADTTTIKTLATPDSPHAINLTLRNNQMDLAMGGNGKETGAARSLFANAKTNNDEITLRITADGALHYENNAQRARLRVGFTGGPRYPKPMPSPSLTQEPQRAGRGAGGR